MSKSRPSAASPLERLRRGDPLAWSSVYALYARRVVGWARSLGLPPGAAEDAAVEVLVRAHREVRGCPGEGALVRWLFGLTWQEVRGAGRLSWLRRGRAVDKEAPSVASTHGLRTEPSGWMARLSYDEAEAVTLCWVEGHSLQAVADMLGVAKGTIASRLRVAREAFEGAEHPKDAAPRGLGRQAP